MAGANGVNVDGGMEIIAGPCSITKANLRQVIEIGQHRVNGIVPFKGVRVVGVKSRTEPTNTSKGGGIDADMMRENQRKFARRGVLSRDLETLPSVLMMEEVLRETPVGVATEVVDPYLQLMSMANHFEDKGIGRGRTLVWNPAVSQIGHPLEFMGDMANEFGWEVGVKNCKEQDPDAKKWSGIIKYVDAGLDKNPHQDIDRRVVAIHRGYDLDTKGKHRNQPLHENAVALRQKFPGLRIYFDPSHIFGPKMRNDIVTETINAMQMTMPDEANVYLYDGILIEAGESPTDTDQHITLPELYDMTSRLSDIRPILGIK